jgi:hypothetical protein
VCDLYIQFERLFVGTEDVYKKFLYNAYIFGPVAHPITCSVVIGTSFSGLKRSGRGACKSSQYSVELENEWRHASAPAPPMRLYVAWTETAIRLPYALK